MIETGFTDLEQKFLPKHTTDGHCATSLSSRHWSWAATCATASNGTKVYFVKQLQVANQEGEEGETRIIPMLRE